MSAFAAVYFYGLRIHVFFQVFKKQVFKKMGGDAGFFQQVFGVDGFFGGGLDDDGAGKWPLFFFGKYLQLAAVEDGGIQGGMDGAALVQLYGVAQGGINVFFDVWGGLDM